MSKLLFYSILLSFFYSCNPKVKNIDKLIVGDWVSNEIQGSFNNRGFVFTFTDSKCSYFNPWGSFSDYHLKEDTLIINEASKFRNGFDVSLRRVFKFNILEISEEQLTMIPNNIETIEYLARYDTLLDTIILNKLFEQSNIPFNRIGFYSSACFGDCPNMYLEMDDVGNFYFKGMAFTDTLGLFQGKLSQNDFALVESKINMVNWSNIDKEYIASWTDDQYCEIFVQTEDTIYQSYVYGYDKEPIELRILLHHLMELYKSVELTEDTSVLSEFTYKNFTPPPLPPPLIE